MFICEDYLVEQNICYIANFRPYFKIQWKNPIGLFVEVTRAMLTSRLAYEICPSCSTLFSPHSLITCTCFIIIFHFYVKHIALHFIMYEMCFLHEVDLTLPTLTQGHFGAYPPELCLITLTVAGFVP